MAGANGSLPHDQSGVDETHTKFETLVQFDISLECLPIRWANGGLGKVEKVNAIVLEISWLHVPGHQPDQHSLQPPLLFSSQHQKIKSLIKQSEGRMQLVAAVQKIIYACLPLVMTLMLHARMDAIRRLPMKLPLEGGYIQITTGLRRPIFEYLSFSA